MTFRAALTNLAGLAVSGVSHNYDIDAAPDDLSRAQLPVLLVLPIEESDDKTFKIRGQGFETVAFSGGPRTTTYAVTHLLLIAPIEDGRGVRTHLPNLIDRIDSYFAALGADVTLGSALLEPAHVRVEPRVFKYGHTSYFGCAFRHIWQVQI